MKRELRNKSVETKVSEAELRALEWRAERAGVTLSEVVRDVLLGVSVEQGTLAAERTILPNFMLKLGQEKPDVTLEQVIGSGLGNRASGAPYRQRCAKKSRETHLG